MKASFDIQGMSCAACQAHVQKAVEKLDGTSDVQVSLLSNRMTCRIDESKCTPGQIEQAVRKAGYGARLRDGTSPAKEKEKEPGTEGENPARLIASFAFLILLMYVSMGHMMWGFPVPPVFSHMENPVGFGLVQMLLVLPILVLNRRYFVSGFTKLYRLHPNMDTLIALGSAISFLYGIYCLFRMSLGQTGYAHYLYFESSGMILVFVSLGKYLESLSKRKTTQAIRRLMDLAPKTAHVVRDGEETEIPASEVRVGDTVVLRSGDRVPVDGTVLEGSGSLDQATLTGESVPVYKETGDTVLSSTVLTSGYIRFRADKVGEDTTFAGIVRLVEEASNSKAPISRLADRISGIFVPVILGIALLVFAGNLLYIHLASPAYVENAFETALNFAVTVIVIACPCALGLATPVAIMVGSGKGAEMGLLIRNAEILEKTHKIGTVILDKTGTVTEGVPVVTDYIPYAGQDHKDVLYALESMSSHPLADAVCRFCRTEAKPAGNVEEFETVPGFGIRGRIGQDRYAVGNLHAAEELPDELRKDYDRLSASGKTPLILARNGRAEALIAVADRIKPGSAEAVRMLKEEGVHVVMLTGDNRSTAEAVAREAGVDEVISDVLPAGKRDVVRAQQAARKGLVAMVGDGVNDAPALMEADVGIAIGSGTDVAMESSDIVLLRNDLRDVVGAMKLSRRTIGTIKRGLFWAFFYNSVCVLLSTGLFYYLSAGAFRMEPMYGAIAMSLSSVSVVLNALTINFFRFHPESHPARNLPDVPSSDGAPEKHKEEINMQEIVLKVKGMMCMHCVAHVEEACRKVEGVVEAKASLETDSVTVKCREGTDRAAIGKAIAEAGYEVV